jgi:hypothetical protein
VGVLGNTSGLTDRPVPYAFYSGIAIDLQGRLYLSGSSQGIPVCSQDGACLAVIPVPGAPALYPQSWITRSGNWIFVITRNSSGSRSALYRIDTRPVNPLNLTAEWVAEGLGHWTLSATPTLTGELLVGQSRADLDQYQVTAYSPDSGTATPWFSLAQPLGATTPWLHVIQSEPDGSISVQHSGGVNWNGRYDSGGTKLGDARSGQLLEGLRYHFGYDGGLRRMDVLDQTATPGDCGSIAREIRLPNQVARVDDRYFFVGRGGALEAHWTGTYFTYTRRVGGVYIEDLMDSGTSLFGIAYEASSNFDVQHPLTVSKTQPIGELLDAGGALHGKNIQALVPAREGCVIVYRVSSGVRVAYLGTATHLAFDVALPEVVTIGQATLTGSTLLLADPGAGVIWQRALMDTNNSVSVWRSGVPGVMGLAATETAVFMATTSTVSRLTTNGQSTVWVAPQAYLGCRRLAATRDHVYVCDPTAHVVDQLDASNGARLARLGVWAGAGSDLSHLNKPSAVVADLNGVYIADRGNGRIVVATTTLWQPEIPPLPRADEQPIVAVQIPLTPPAAGRMSVNVYTTNDLTVRQLACNTATGNSITWDGRDMYDHWAQPGTYRYHGLIAPTLGLRYVTSVGQSGNPPYRTADGKGSWGGVWGYVMDICTVDTNAGSDVVVLWAFEEGEGGLIRMSPDGAVRWKQHLAWWMQANQMAVASDGTSVYIAGASALNGPDSVQRRPLLWRVDAASGATRLYAADQSAQPMFGAYTNSDRVVTDLEVRGGLLYMTAPAQNALYVIDATNAAVVHTWSVPNVSGAAFDSGGQLVVGSSNRLVRIGTTGAVESVVAEMGGPVWDVAGKADGGFAVSVGAPRHQVVTLDAGGNETRALGQSGGRPRVGQMIPTSFRDPVGLCLEADGTLFVAERAAPKRFTRWSAGGALEREFHGPYYFSGMFGIDEAEPENIYGDTHTDLIRYKVNYDTGAWYVDHYWIGAYTDSGVPAKWWPRVRRHGAQTWWCSGSAGIVALEDDRARGVAAVYGGWVKPLAGGGYQPRYWQENTGLKGTWSDLNGDGLVQTNEWQITNAPTYPMASGGPQQGWGAYFDAAFNLYMHDWTDNAAGGVWKLAAAWSNDAPVYGWDRARHVGLQRAGVGLAHGASAARTAFAEAGGVYAFNGGYNAAGLPGVGHGADWEFAQVTKYDETTGQPLWHAGERSSGFAAPGQHYCPTGPAGLIGDYLFWTDENSLIHTWDAQHGLYIATLLEDISRGPTPSPYTIWVELFNSRVFRHPVSGKVYLVAASDAIHIFEVLGADQPLQRFQGEFELTAAGLAAAQAAWAQRGVPTAREFNVYRTPQPVVVDGQLGEFAGAQTAALTLSASAQGSARLLYDASYLYLACEVVDDSPWVNAGGDDTALFKTGDAVSLWTGTNNTVRTAGLGDLRLLFAPTTTGGVKVVEYRAKVSSGAQPVHFDSPSGSVILDRVRVTTNVSAAVVASAGGYRLEAAIPLTFLGLDPGTLRFGLDVSIDFSDPAGQHNVACLRWGRNGASLVYDLPTEARLEPGTWGAGLFGAMLGPNWGGTAYTFSQCQP